MLIAYIHGFLSGPNAVKAQILRQYLHDHHPGMDFYAPDFADTPAQAFADLLRWADDLAGQSVPVMLVGSSMGGFFANLLSNMFGFKAALVNPCVHPQDFFQDLTGEQVNPSTERHFILKPYMYGILSTLDAAVRPDPKRLQIWLERGDEVLDYHRALNFYQNCDCKVLDGGCHAFAHFAQIMPEALNFLLRD